MKMRRHFALPAVCALAAFALGAGPAQAAKHVRSKSYTYCDFEKTGSGSVCFPGPFVLFPKTHTWRFEEPPEEVSGTYTVSGKSYVFHETQPAQRDELIGTRGKHGVISGTLYENGQPSEFTFTLTPR